MYVYEWGDTWYMSNIVSCNVEFSYQCLTESIYLQDIYIYSPPGYGQFEKVSLKRYVSQMENPKMSLCENALVRKFMFRKFKTTFKIESNTWQILFCCIGFAQKNFFISSLNFMFCETAFFVEGRQGQGGLFYQRRLLYQGVR